MAGAVSGMITPEPSRQPFVRAVWVIGGMSAAFMCFVICVDIAISATPRTLINFLIGIVSFSGMSLFMWLAKIAWED